MTFDNRKFTRMDRPAERDDDDVDEGAIELVDVWGHSSHSQMRLIRTSKICLKSDIIFIVREDSGKCHHLINITAIPVSFFLREFILPHRYHSVFIRLTTACNCERTYRRMSLRCLTQWFLSHDY